MINWNYCIITVFSEYFLWLSITRCFFSIKKKLLGIFKNERIAYPYNSLKFKICPTSYIYNSLLPLYFQFLASVWFIYLFHMAYICQGELCLQSSPDNLIASLFSFAPVNLSTVRHRGQTNLHHLTSGVWIDDIFCGLFHQSHLIFQAGPEPAPLFVT